MSAVIPGFPVAPLAQDSLGSKLQYLNFTNVGSKGES